MRQINLANATTSESKNLHKKMNFKKTVLMCRGAAETIIKTEGYQRHWINGNTRNPSIAKTANMLLEFLQHYLKASRVHGGGVVSPSLQPSIYQPSIPKD
jgi:hypothetical protein